MLGLKQDNQHDVRWSTPPRFRPATWEGPLGHVSRPIPGKLPIASKIHQSWLDDMVLGMNSHIH